MPLRSDPFSLLSGRFAAWAVSLGAPSEFDTRIITLRNAARRDRSLKYNMLAVEYISPRPRNPGIIISTLRQDVIRN